jgi:hypothetical protein
MFRGSEMARLAPTLIALAVLAVAPSCAFAAGAKGCEAFLWPLATELAWMKAADSEMAAAGATLPAPPEKAIALALQPASDVKFVVTPTSTPKPEDAKSFGGVLSFERMPAAGQVQITISTHAWIDVVQNGATLEATGHTGSPDCDSIRKSVRFEVGPGPFSLQISSAPEDTIKIAIRPAAD